MRKLFCRWFCITSRFIKYVGTINLCKFCVFPKTIVACLIEEASVIEWGIFVENICIDNKYWFHGTWMTISSYQTECSGSYSRLAGIFYLGNEIFVSCRAHRTSISIPDWMFVWILRNEYINYGTINWIY